MSKRTIILFVILIVISVMLVYTTTTTSKTASPVPVITKPVVQAHSILSLEQPSSLSTQPQTLDITIDSQGDNVTTVQAEIVYDPSKIENVHVDKGTFFSDPIVLFNHVNQKTGRISYAIGILPLHTPHRGSGTVATITYDITPGASGSSTFTFLPKTQVTALGIQQSVLKTTNDAIISLPSPQPTQKTH